MSNARPTTQIRHRRVNERFNFLYSQKVEGVSLDLDSLMNKLADEFGYSRKTVNKILKAR